MSSISWSDISSVVFSEPSDADATAVNPNGINTLLPDDVSTFFINSKITFINPLLPNVPF